ncbi:GLPGLI family protein [Lutibacter sp.]|uniref:GLPGLI family protein n=1 Tax=Lutibacter sp. TaxID=1925666 RepID=UPI001A1F5C24|nr:GLPGLI family protein [Lutibacter sp.]MBI9041877.1 GLPGLI family protein [Lutibacter sp.]
MKYIKILFLLFLISKSVNSQNSYKALYNIHFYNNDSISKIDESSMDSKKKQMLFKMRADYKKSLSYSESVNFVLDFDKKNSLFYLPNQLEINKNSIKILKRIGRFKGSYYFNNKKTIQSKNSFGQDFLLEVPKFEWIIYKDVKKIGIYNCYKATTKKYIEGSRGVEEQLVVAWYSKELPFNYGPKEYNGLPGLIVQLEEGNILFKLKSIEIFDHLEINEPMRGRSITQKEFNDLSKRMFNGFKK